MVESEMMIWWLLTEFEFKISHIPDWKSLSLPHHFFLPNNIDGALPDSCGYSSIEYNMCWQWLIDRKPSMENFRNWSSTKQVSNNENMSVDTPSNHLANLTLIVKGSKLEKIGHRFYEVYYYTWYKLHKLDLLRTIKLTSGSSCARKGGGRWCAWHWPRGVLSFLLRLVDLAIPCIDSTEEVASWVI